MGKESLNGKGWDVVSSRQHHDCLVRCAWFPTIHRNGNRTVYTRSVETATELPAALFSGP